MSEMNNLEFKGCKCGALLWKECKCPMTDQELNEAVARKLGYDVFETYGYSGERVTNIRRNNEVDPLPDYSGSIAAAWGIFDFLISKGGGGAVLYSEQRKLWEAAITDKGNTSGDSIETSDTAAKAICLAFLKLP